MQPAAVAGDRLVVVRDENVRDIKITHRTDHGFLRIKVSVENGGVIVGSPESRHGEIGDRPRREIGNARELAAHEREVGRTGGGGDPVRITRARLLHPLLQHVHAGRRIKLHIYAAIAGGDHAVGIICTAPQTDWRRRSGGRIGVEPGGIGHRTHAIRAKGRARRNGPGTVGGELRQRGKSGQDQTENQERGFGGSLRTDTRCGGWLAFHGSVTGKPGRFPGRNRRFIRFRQILVIQPIGADLFKSRMYVHGFNQV